MESLSVRIKECILIKNTIMKYYPDVSDVTFQLNDCDPKEVQDLAEGTGVKLFQLVGGEMCILVKMFDEENISIFAKYKNKIDNIQSEIDDLYKDSGDKTDRYHR